MAKRKYGEGSVFLRKDGLWEVRIIIGYNESGNPKTKNVTAKTQAECKEKLQALKEKWGEPVTGSSPICHSAIGWTSGIRTSPSPRSDRQRKSATRTASTTTSSRRLVRYRCASSHRTIFSNSTQG